MQHVFKDSSKIAVLYRGSQLGYIVCNRFRLLTKATVEEESLDYIRGFRAVMLNQHCNQLVERFLVWFRKGQQTSKQLVGRRPDDGQENRSFLLLRRDTVRGKKLF